MNRYFLNRLAGRVVRRVLGMQREPVRQMSEGDYRLIEHAFAFVVATAALGLVASVLLLLNWRPTC
ncbi:hypothetical protein LMG27174_05756 [Paraburkholderia rhynchosiae]|uniref:Uncharacterized protein n=1 Tax=Paraburkholderia rhynchosiae TaxID=487049 RepID=A0A6J5CBQ7_9BURK|nr:hypothetical protein LMG27174_05756 [Paraburkholderia rhynchosiae]